MTKGQILDGNIKCLEFMKVEPRFECWSGDFAWNDGPFFSTRNKTFGKAMDSIVKYAKYDSDWNWLMGVVKKISDLAYETEGLFETEEYMMVGLFVMRGNIEGAFPCIVKLLDFYNDNSTK